MPTHTCGDCRWALCAEALLCLGNPPLPVRFPGVRSVPVTEGDRTVALGLTAGYPIVFAQTPACRLFEARPAPAAKE